MAVRGHGNFGRTGDIDYIGQLEDDLADFVAVLRPLHPSASFSLIGFSSGGGFVLRAIATSDEKLFDRIALSLLNRLGIDWFNGLPIVAFATSPEAPNLTSVYSFRLAVDFGAPPARSACHNRARNRPHRDDCNAGWYCRRAKVFSGPDGTRDRLNLPPS